MIYESYPWKEDLRKHKNLLIKHNRLECFQKNEDATYTTIEKSIFYSAFIIRKLIDCKSKLSDEADDYSLKAYKVKPLKPINRLHNYPEEMSHDWKNERQVIVSGKNACNWLIHSYLFFVGFNDDGVIDSFFVSSDYDKNKVLYRISLGEWIKYMDFVASDDVTSMKFQYSETEKDYVCIRKERGR